jgi:glutaredoxin
MFCDKVKEFLSHQGIRYAERDVTQDDTALNELEKMGVFTTPVTVFDGETVIGFDRAKLKALLSASNS